MCATRVLVRDEVTPRTAQRGCVTRFEKVNGGEDQETVLGLIGCALTHSAVPMMSAVSSKKSVTWIDECGSVDVMKVHTRLLPSVRCNNVHLPIALGTSATRHELQCCFLDSAERDNMHS